MAILYKGKPVDDVKILEQTDIYGNLGYLGRLALGLIVGEDRAPIKRVVIKPAESLVEIVQAGASPRQIRNDKINLNNSCQKLKIKYRLT